MNLYNLEVKYIIFWICYPLHNNQGSQTRGPSIESKNIGGSIQDAELVV